MEFGFRCLIMLLTLILLGEFAVSAQQADTSQMKQEADGFYQKQDWQNALAAYEKIITLEETNHAARYRYGFILLNLNKNEAAKIQLEKVFAASPNPIFAQQLARVYARLGNREKTYEVLESSLKLGGIAPETLTAEADFVFLKNEERFKELIKKSDLAANPCKASPEFRQFDFWTGEWDAKNAQGVIVGSSSIVQILGQCVIFENWSTPVSNGKSFNTYNAGDRKWHQAWVDDKGTFTHYTGEFVDGNMVFIAETGVGGKQALAKMTFSKLAGGDVRQLGENSVDGGKTWTTSFEFTYIRKNKRKQN